MFAGLDHVGILACLVGSIYIYIDFRGCSVNWMELCHPRDGSGVVYAVGNRVEPQEKTRVSWTESSAGRRARASLERTRNENLDSCAEIKSDMGISGELYGYAVMIEARYASRWGSQLCTAVSSIR